MAVAVYPGTFDPLTRGHEDVMRRAARIFDRAILAVADSRGKNPIFSAEERVEIAREALADCPNIEVIGFSGLLRDFVVSNKANVIVRGLRSVADYEYEFQMAGMNRYLMPDVETIFVTPTEANLFISGTLVREIAKLGGDVSGLVSAPVLNALQAKVATTH
jgi:pantetheine-phosphate adenylyltransferase